MSFLTDTSWPQVLIEIFDICRQEYVRKEARYRGPYDALLNYIVAETAFDFFVVPQCIPNVDNQTEAVDFVICWKDMRRGEARPVLIVEVKDDTWANSSSKRLEADEQIRQRIDQMLPNCPLHRLYGVSFLGTSIRVYSGRPITRDVIPEVVYRPFQDRHPPADFLEGRWDMDILSQEGLMEMQRVMEHIIYMSDTLYEPV